MVNKIKLLEEQRDLISIAIKQETEKELMKEVIKEQQKEIEEKSKEVRKIKEKAEKEIPKKLKVDKSVDIPLSFKKEEKSTLLNPISWFKSDKTNPMVMVILSPAGDLTIRERVVDQRGNLSLGKNTLYRVEHNEIWDIADSDIKGFSGKRVLFFFQDQPNPIRIRRDDKGTKVTVNTETYAKSQKSHLLSELLAPEMTISDYLTMILIGANIVLSLVIAFKLFFMK